MARPNAREISARLLVLVRVVQWDASAPEEGADVAALAHGAARAEADLRERGLWELATESEQRFLTRSPLEADERMRVDASWSLEALAPLSWALGLVPELPPYEAVVEPEFLAGFPDASLDELTARAQPRSDAERDRARSLAELWLWRARTRELIERRTPPPRGFKSFDEIVRKAAANGQRQKLLDTLVDGDFALFGRAYRDLDPQAFATVRSLSIERLRAHNWLCGRAPENRWDRTPIDA